jgi:hypothetical protein
MRLFIPAIGDRIKPWEFGLYLERRNLKFAQELVEKDEKN